MKQFYYILQKGLCTIAFFLLFSPLAKAQTLTLGSVDAGPYTPGSSIAVPFTVNTSSGCIKPDNVFNLYISSVPGGTPNTLIGSYDGFYATFVNGTIPTGLADGSYNLAIQSTMAPATSSTATINIVAGSPVEAKLTSTVINSSYPDVFGNCSGNGTTYTFSNSSTSGAIITTDVFDEINQMDKGPLTFNASQSASFNAAKVNYTIFVKATYNGVEGTKAYQLVNNRLTTNFGTTSGDPVCLTNGQGVLMYTILPAAIQNNYPGDLYTVDWGDGSSSQYTLCDLLLSNGQLSHAYTRSSCGTSSGGQINSFPVNAQASSNICGTLGSPLTSYAKVVTQPVNNFTGPQSACLNVPVTFYNTSDPGQDASNPNCQNSNALYTWIIDKNTPNEVQFTGYALSTPFTYHFTTSGHHTITLRYESQSNTVCSATDVDKDFCVLAPPRPSFTLTSSTICSGSVVTPTDQSYTDNSCSSIPANNAYTWSVTGPAAVSYLNNTTSASHQPDIKFTSPGVYTLTLSIGTESCGAVSTSQTITVNTTPTVTLSADKEYCGTNITLAFSNAAGPTQTIFTGTTTDQANTYSWTVTGGNYSYADGTGSNSKYPHILFTDFGVYTVTATETNNCGTASDSQQITFLQSPTVNAGPDQTICPNDVVQLAGTISNPQPQSYQWTGGNGTFSPDRNTLNATYTPSNAEIDAGQVSLNLVAITGYSGTCSQVSDEVIITINPRNALASNHTKNICTGNPVAYQPAAQLLNSTFTWTSTVTSGTVSGNTAIGAGNITDNLTGNGIVTYTITPYSDQNSVNCPGTTSTLVVTVMPRPVATATPAATTVCSGQAINIALSSDLNGSTYNWTSVASAGISGNTNPTATNAIAITDNLSNSSTTATGSVTYTIIPIGPSPGFCEGSPVMVTITVQPLPVQADAGPDEDICAETSYRLRGNDPGISTGTWTFIPTSSQNQSDVSFDNANQYNTIVNGLQPGQIYTFRWTINGVAPCNATFDDVSINNLSPLINTISFGAPAVCYGQSITINGDQQTGGSGTYIYTWQSSADGSTNSWTTISGASGQNYTFTSTESIYIKRLISSTPCSSESQPVYVVVQRAIANNTISGDQVICYNNTPVILNGSTPDGGDGNFSYQWQSTVDNGANWDIIGGATNINYQPVALTVTTKFRRIVTTAFCVDDQKSTSNLVTITVNPQNTNTITSDANRTICTGASFTYHITPRDANTSFTWVSSVSSGTVTGNTARGSVDNINDVLSNSDLNTKGTVTYTITPINIVNNISCPAASFTLTVTVAPLPVLKLTSTGNQICSGQRTGITFTTNLTRVSVKWTFDQVQGIYGANPQFPVVATRIDDLLTSDLTSPATVTYHITPISEDGCVGTTVDATVTVLPQPVTANAGPDEAVCNVNSYTLKANDPSPSSGKWTVTSGQTSVGFADDTRYNTTVNGLQPGQNYTFRWTITSTGACSTSSDDVTISDLTALTNNISFSAPAVCYGQTITVTGDRPTGGTGTYAYAWESSTDNVTWTTVADQTGAGYSFTGTESIFIRRIVSSGPCVQISSPVHIIVQPAISNNTIGSNQQVCYNDVPTLFSGSAASGADGNYSYQWQSSRDNGAAWTDIPGATMVNYQAGNLTITTLFRRNVTSALCTGPQQSISNMVTVIVNPLPDATFTYTADLGCIPFIIDAANIKATAAPGNQTYSWYADNVLIGTGIDFPGYTITTDSTHVTIKLVVTSKFSCPDASFSHVFSTRKEVTAGFGQDQIKGCGPLTVTFSNTSNPQNAATYHWDFGNGMNSTLANPNPVTFNARPDGKDTTYQVTLRAYTSCGIRTFASTVTVRPKPTSIFTPDKTIGCSPLTINLNNTSPGTGNTYTYDFGDGETLVTSDNRLVSHTYTSSIIKNYVVSMVAQNECGSSRSQYTIRITPSTVVPQLVVNGDQKAGCAPWTVQFYNNTKGGIYFTYDFGDGTTVNTLTAPEVVSHTFLKDGIYNVKLTATNGCSDTSVYQSITVYAQPVVGFTSDVQKGCSQLTVNFKNQTAGNNSYSWNFGDGGTSALANPKHTFTARSTPYTVTLIATNTLGCMDTLAKKDYITVHVPPSAAFIARPDSVIAYPNYSFSFADRSTNNPILWKWDFGDGSTVSKQNPNHTYLDTGSYRVKLVVYDLYGCADTVTHIVQITGVPGQLFVPNAFMPTSKFQEILTFKAKGSGIAHWRMRVFNKWGQVIWESTKLTDRGEPAEGWDGMMNGQPAPQGVYVWQIDATFINGEEWKGMSYKGSTPSRTGVIHLIQ